MDSYIFRSLACFIGAVALGSTLPDVFRFVQGKEWLGHSALVPVLILSFVATAYCIGLITKHLLKRHR